MIRGHLLRPADWSHIAMHRSGSLDVGLSTEGALRREEHTAVFLTKVVSRVWAAGEMFRRIADRCGLLSPFEVVIGIRNTNGARLESFAEGWGEMFDLRTALGCTESTYLSAAN